MKSISIVNTIALAFATLTMGACGSGGETGPLAFPSSSKGTLDDTVAKEIIDDLGTYWADDLAAIHKGLPSNRRAFSMPSTDSGCTSTISRGAATDADHDGVPADIAFVETCSTTDNLANHSRTEVDGRDSNDGDWQSGYSGTGKYSIEFDSVTEDQTKKIESLYQGTCSKEGDLFNVDLRQFHSDTKADGSLSRASTGIYVKAKISPTLVHGENYDSLDNAGTYQTFGGFYAYTTKSKQEFVLAISGSGLTYSNEEVHTGTVVLTDGVGNTITFDASTRSLGVFTKK